MLPRMNTPGPWIDARLVCARATRVGRVRGPKAYQGTPPARLWLYLDNVDAAWKRALEAGAKETMALGDQFWGDRMGQIEDFFGHVWSLAQHVKDMTPEELKKAGVEFFAHMEPQKR